MVTVPAPAVPSSMIIDQQPPTPTSDDAPAAVTWEFVRLADYQLPNPVGASAALEKWASLRRLFRHGGNEEAPPVKAEHELRALPDSRLHGLVQPIDWRAAAAALDRALADWLHDGKSGPLVRFVIGQPHCGHAEILAHWAARHRAACVAPPGAEQILGGDEHWLEDWPGDHRLWVLPNLEHCYLRHADGLGLVRRLLAQSVSGALGRGVIACDSWAWAYLQEVWPQPQPDALTLQAFDGQRLSSYLADLASRANGGKLRFRNAATGKEVQLVPAAQGSEVSPEIAQIAVHSRGNIGAAWTSWRSLLRSSPELPGDAEPAVPVAGKLAPASGASDHSGLPGEHADRDGETVWLSAVRHDAALPVEKGEGMAFILHTLLLHNGLPASLLPALLPQPEHRIASHVLQLQALGIVTLAGERWRISAAAYPVVREFLRRRGFLRDAF